ncbi:hypothetical protein [Streptomyces chryseus]
METGPHARARRTAFALLAALVVAGCSQGRPAAGPTMSSPSPQRTSPEEICAELVSYWAKEALKGGKWAGLDWEQKGLSNAQYALHEQIVSAGRAEAKRHGMASALRLVDGLALRECAAQDGATANSENWRPPG